MIVILTENVYFSEIENDFLQKKNPKFIGKNRILLNNINMVLLTLMLLWFPNIGVTA